MSDGLVVVLDMSDGLDVAIDIPDGVDSPVPFWLVVEMSDGLVVVLDMSDGLDVAIDIPDGVDSPLYLLKMELFSKLQFVSALYCSFVKISVTMMTFPIMSLNNVFLSTMAAAPLLSSL
jgi:hypothetical protein